MYECLCHVCVFWMAIGCAVCGGFGGVTGGDFVCAHVFVYGLCGSRDAWK